MIKNQFNFYNRKQMDFIFIINLLVVFLNWATKMFHWEDKNFHWATKVLLSFNDEICSGTFVNLFIDFRKNMTIKIK